MVYSIVCIILPSAVISEAPDVSEIPKDLIEVEMAATSSEERSVEVFCSSLFSFWDSATLEFVDSKI